ncbi:hypothetical protein BX666DRAFT_1928362 [Dichotomocladium elegans]|nr:hypothetical protein BX666DRAFT_1928362 [Dichotomocladium elegans]
MSATQEQAKGHRALLDVESRFNAKLHGVVLGIQGSQIQALASFIEIFDQYPYPVIINAAILKLADWFRVSNNVIKFYVYRVFKQASKQHLTKVINVEETVRRVLPVLGSNDPIARSIALRILGCMSMIIADKIEIHYAVLQRLESATDRTEMESAIWAADRICARSIRFAPVIFPRIEDKLNDVTLPCDTKLRLVQLFRHMHKDIDLTRMAKKSCINMLDNSSMDEKLTVVTLRTLSILLKEALLDRKEHIRLLFKYGLNDPRESVSSAALYDLVLIAQSDITLDPQSIHQLFELVTAEATSPRLIRKRYTCVRKVIWSYRDVVGHMLRETWVDNGEIFEDAIRVCEKRLLESISKEDIAAVIACTRFIVTLAEISKPTPSHKQQDRMAQILSDASMRFSGYLRTINLENIMDGEHISQVLKLEAHLLAQFDGFDGNETFLETFNLMMNTREPVAKLLPAFLSSISRKCQDQTRRSSSSILKI